MRYLGSALLVGVAATHILEAQHEEAHYMVALFALLAAASIILAACLAAGVAVAQTWGAAALLCATAVLGYIVSRTAGMPQMADDIGNWAEPLGVAALACEAGLIALAASQLRAGRSYFSSNAFRLSSVLSASRSDVP